MIEKIDNFVNNMIVYSPDSVFLPASCKFEIVDFIVLRTARSVFKGLFYLVEVYCSTIATLPCLTPAINKTHIQLSFFVII